MTRIEHLRRRLAMRLKTGFTLIETMLAFIVLLVVMAGLMTLFGIAIRSNSSDKVSVELLNSARAKIEQIESIPYQQIGINSATSASGPGYFVVDPINNPTYDPTSGDILLSDTVTLKDGTLVTRTITVAAIDDSADGTGDSDQDDVTDPNTNTVLDYKQVTVTATATVQKVNYTQTLRTFIQGSLDSELNGATGTDAPDASPPPAPGKTKPTPPPKASKTPAPPPTGCDSGITAPATKKPGRKGVSMQTGC